MSKTQHTPGPWSADTAGIIRAECSAQPLPFAIAVALSDADVGRGRGDANARLIAAAPELLEALNAFLRAPSIGSSGPGSSTIVVQEFNLRAAWAAVAKATGGAA